MNNKDFKKINGKEIKDIANYINSYIKNSSDKIKVVVGTDSQVYKNYTAYAIAVCLYHEGNGGHVLYSKEKIFDKEEVLSNRLWKEVKRTVGVADYIRNNISVKNEVETHFDINPNEQFDSNSIYKAATGFAVGAGFNFIVKPHSYAATCVADRFC